MPFRGPETQEQAEFLERRRDKAARYAQKNRRLGAFYEKFLVICLRKSLRRPMIDKAIDNIKEVE